MVLGALAHLAAVAQAQALVGADAEATLRHTFASHFMQKGGSILFLQKFLGRSGLAMTMRYAHLAPDHLADAIKLDPLVWL